jgi:hypothetical protein
VRAANNAAASRATGIKPPAQLPQSLSSYSLTSIASLAFNLINLLPYFLPRIRLRNPKKQLFTLNFSNQLEEKRVSIVCNVARCKKDVNGVAGNLTRCSVIALPY